MDFVAEIVYVYSVKGFAEVYGDYYGTFRWRIFLEALGNLGS
jgi:hypothetical protein